MKKSVIRMAKKSVIRVEWQGGHTYVPSNLEGQYVKRFDPNKFEGRGELIPTRNRDEAMVFASAEEAWDFYRQQSTTHPTRPDGKPNRPLTAFTVTIEPMP
jgi:hypothetical protein